MIESVNCGRWKIRNWFYAPCKIHTWGIIYFGDTPDRYTDNTLNEFYNRLPIVIILCFLLVFITFLLVT